GVFFVFLADFVLEQTRAHDLQGALLVLLLTAAVLTADDAAGGNVQDLDRGVRRIDALAAGTAGAADFGAEIGHLKVGVHRYGLGQHGVRGGGGVDASLSLGGGHALDAMDAGFVAHFAKDRFPREPENDFLQAAQVRGARVHGLDLETVGVGKPAV